jgi:hypothetical protein
MGYLVLGSGAYQLFTCCRLEKAEMAPELKQAECGTDFAQVANAYASPSSAPLTTIQQCVLALLELDPSLNYMRQRPRLRLLAQELDPCFDARDVGRALVRLRQLRVEGSLRTHAFDGITCEGPELEKCIEVVRELGARCGWPQGSMPDLGNRRVRLLRLLGHVVSPESS